jgi:hypothetical protein
MARASFFLFWLPQGILPRLEAWSIFSGSSRIKDQFSPTSRCSPGCWQPTDRTIRPFLLSATMGSSAAAAVWTAFLEVLIVIAGDDHRLAVFCFQSPRFGRFTSEVCSHFLPTAHQQTPRSSVITRIFQMPRSQACSCFSFAIFIALLTLVAEVGGERVVALFWIHKR